ncbi:MAG: glycogen/starch/alpha-glucan family phosphorylase [Alphaproteobacteria bacterium]|nr:glycogen/starch/alpha-glucan family phosphorylase [Alphaproteobacteria bacterium]
MQKTIQNPNYFKEGLLKYLKKSARKNPKDVSSAELYDALTKFTNEELSRLATKSETRILNSKKRFACYLSMEYLLGSLGMQTLLSLEAVPAAVQAFAYFGSSLPKVMSHDVATQLGNGGLGRLAACFFDSIATKRLPVFGYGLFYRCGIFKQSIGADNKQISEPDMWLRENNICVIKRDDVGFEIPFGGYVENPNDLNNAIWWPSEIVRVQARDIVLAGFGANYASTIRLWEAERPDASAPSLDKQIKNITDFLYPPDGDDEGRKLRLKQEFVLVAASINDMFDRFKKTKLPIEQIDQFVRVQLNDTHPTLAIPEIVRILIQDYGFTYERAFEKMYSMCAYTNHTLLAEALEKIGSDMFRRLLPHHFSIIERMHKDFMNKAEGVKKINLDNVGIINYDKGYVNCGNLCMAATSRVNGVAKLHSDLLAKKEFVDFSRIFPHKFTNVTNGITPRRWLLQTNARLSNILAPTIGNSWITDLNRLKSLLKFKRSRLVLSSLLDMKYENKKELFHEFEQTLGLKLNPRFMLDSQIKRIHEYKRQFLAIMHAIYRYNKIIDGKTKGLEPRVILFAGKAHPAYEAGKDIITLIGDVAKKINNDPRAHHWLKVVFVPNYNIDLAEKIIRASDLSEQISTAGKEASGTGNMKLALNGALTIGTLDGANVEIRDFVGRRNFFLFGLTARQVYKLKERGYNAQKYFETQPEIIRIMRQITGGFFGANKYETLLKQFMESGDQYMLLADFKSYVKAQRKADKLFARPFKWSKKMLLNIAKCGFFSSDRSMDDYAKNIWGIEEV